MKKKLRGGKCPRVGIVRSWKFPELEMSRVGIYHSGNFPGWELSRMGIVRDRICPRVGIVQEWDNYNP